MFTVTQAKACCVSTHEVQKAMRRFSLAIMILGFAIGILSITGCGEGDNTDGGLAVDAVNNPGPQANTTVSFSALDAFADRRLTSSVIRVDGQMISDDGTATLRKQIPAGETSTLIASARATNYRSTSRRVTLTGGEDTRILLFMIPSDDPMRGVAIGSTQMILDEGGKSSTAISVATGNAAHTATANAVLSIPANTVMRNASGTPVSGGVRALLAAFDPAVGARDADKNGILEASEFDGSAANKVLELLPGAPATYARQQDGTTAEGSFISVAFTHIELKQPNGQEVNRFDSPVEITLFFQKGFLDPRSGEPLNAGDTIPIWRFNTNEGQWQHIDARAVRSSEANDDLVSVSFRTKQPGYYQAAFLETNTCNTKVQFEGMDNSTGLWLRSTLQTGAGYLFSGYNDGPKGRFARIQSPAGRSVVAKAYQGGPNGALVGEAIVRDACAGDIGLPVQLANTSSGTISGNITASCSDGSDDVVEPLPATVFVSGGGAVLSDTTDANGSYEVSTPVLNTTYTVSIVPDDTSLDSQQTNRVELTDDSPEATVNADYDILDCTTVGGAAN